MTFGKPLCCGFLKAGLHLPYESAIASGNRKKDCICSQKVGLHLQSERIVEWYCWKFLLPNGDRFMKRLVATCVALVAASFTAVASAEDLESGLQVGESAGAFNVLDVTGPNAGRKLCYR